MGRGRVEIGKTISIKPRKLRTVRPDYSDVPLPTKTSSELIEALKEVAYNSNIINKENYLHTAVNLEIHYRTDEEKILSDDFREISYFSDLEISSKVLSESLVSQLEFTARNQTDYYRDFIKNAEGKEMVEQEINEENIMVAFARSYQEMIMETYSLLFSKPEDYKYARIFDPQLRETIDKMSKQQKRKLTDDLEVFFSDLSEEDFEIEIIPDYETDVIEASLKEEKQKEISDFLEHYLRSL